MKSMPRWCSACGIMCRKNGFKKVVIGLSGGIDSAITAAIAVDAARRGQCAGTLHALAVHLARTAVRMWRTLARRLRITCDTICDHADIRPSTGKPSSASFAGHGPADTTEENLAGPHSAGNLLDGVFEQVRPSRADHREQERDERGVRDVVWRHGRRICGD
jgi:hypothetical protein